ncbi:hypothetical protein MMC14_001716 [Varicellaria rhodocarpa]|nr:hypothetical protein [Varicellaria rhodocarpa]
MVTKVSKKPLMVRPKPQRRLHFLTLPLEIREQVYSKVVIEAPRSLLQLLRSNRQISHEAQPFIFKQSFVFDGQEDLFRWLRQVNRIHLRHVISVSLILHDIDPKKIIGALGEMLRRIKISQSTAESATNPYIVACDQQIKQIGEALFLMPNIKDFTILDCKPTDQRPPHRMLVSFTDELTTRLPHLQNLSIQIDSLPTPFISKFQRLRFLYHPGFSTSTPSETQSALSTLQHLTSLHISGPSSNLAFQQRQGYSGPLRTQCVTPAVLLSLTTTNLRTISIYDPFESTATTNPATKPSFLTPAFIRALSSPALSSSLTTLRLATSHPSFPVQAIHAFCAYLTSSRHRLTRLDLAIPLDFYLTEEEDFGSGGGGVGRKKKRVDVREFLEDVFETLEEGVGGLREVWFCKKESMFERERGVRRWVEGGMEAVGVRVRWGEWEDWFRG